MKSSFLETVVFVRKENEMCPFIFTLFWKMIFSFITPLYISLNINILIIFNFKNYLIFCIDYIFIKNIFLYFKFFITNINILLWM